MLIIFNLIYCTYLGRGSGEVEGGEGSPPFTPPTPFLLRFVCVCPLHPHPLVIWMWFYFLSVSSLLLPLSNPSAPISPPPFVSCSFLGFCTTQLVYTVYTQPAKRKPNGKHFIGWLECLCPATWRGGGWGVAGMGRVWNLECGFSRALEGGWAGVTVFHYVLLC